MSEGEWLAARFEENRQHLQGVAFRMLGSPTRRKTPCRKPGCVLAAPMRADLAAQREIVGAFLAASRGGDFQALLELLDPDIVLGADSAVVQMGATARVTGADAAASTFSGRARAARPALVDGVPGAAWAQDGRFMVVFDFRVTNGKITGIEMIADPETIGDLDVEAARG